MFNNIGGKIKWAAKTCTILGMILSGILGLSMIGVFFAFAEGWAYIVGILVGAAAFALGSLIAWVSSWLLYGYGELIDKTAQNEFHNRYLRNAYSKADVSVADMEIPSQPQVNVLKEVGAGIKKVGGELKQKAAPIGAAVVEKASEIKKSISNNDTSVQHKEQSQAETEAAIRLNKLRNLRILGAITEEEFQKAISEGSCPKCGNKIPEGSKFCNLCGHRLGE